MLGVMAGIGKWRGCEGLLAVFVQMFQLLLKSSLYENFGEASAVVWSLNLWGNSCFTASDAALWLRTWVEVIAYSLCKGCECRSAFWPGGSCLTLYTDSDGQMWSITTALTTNLKPERFSAKNRFCRVMYRYLTNKHISCYCKGFSPSEIRCLYKLLCCCEFSQNRTEGIHQFGFCSGYFWDFCDAVKNNQSFHKCLAFIG